MDLEVFLTVLRGVTSPDEPTRKAAEQQLQEGKERQPGRLLSLVFHTLQAGPGSGVEDDVRLQAAVLLRNAFRGSIEGDSHVWGKLSEPERVQLKQSLLQAVAAAASSTSAAPTAAAATGASDALEKGGSGSSSSRRLLRVNLCDAVSELAADLVPVGQWDELGDALMQFIQSEVPEQQQSGWRILSEVAPILTSQLAAAANHICRLLVRAMAAGQNVHTRVEAFSLLVALVEDSNKKVYKKLLPDRSSHQWQYPPIQLLMLDTLDAALKAGAAEGDFSVVDRMMAFVIQLCEADRGGGVLLLRPCFPQFCSIMLALSVAGQQMSETAAAAEAAAAAAGAAAAAAANDVAPAMAVAAAAEAAEQEQQRRKQQPLQPYSSAAAAAAAAKQQEIEGLSSCRQLAIEALLCCAEQKGSVLRNVPGNAVKNLVEALLLCMLDIRDSSYDRWLTEGEEDDDEQRFFDVGEEGLDRLCRAYSGTSSTGSSETHTNSGLNMNNSSTSLLPRYSAAYNNATVTDAANSGGQQQQQEPQCVIPRSGSVHRNLIVQLLYPTYIAEFLQRREWEYRFVALMAIAQTAEYLRNEDDEEDPEEGEEEVACVVRALMDFLADEDFRVRFAAAQAIGQIALDQAPFVQQQFAKEMLPRLIERMEDQVPRVQGHACAAFVNFAEEVDKEELIFFAEDVMNKLVLRMQPGAPKTVREHAITAAAVVAGVLEEKFEPFYAAVIPLLLEVIQNSTATEQRALRGKAIECVSIVGLSVGHDRFLADGKMAMEALLQIAGSTAPATSASERATAAGGAGGSNAVHAGGGGVGGSGEEEGDVVREYLCEALGRMCRVMGADFIVYLPRILPSLLEVLAIKPKAMKTEDVDETDEDMTYVFLDGQTSLSLKTSLVEEQARALDLLCTITTVLQEPLAAAAAACAPAAAAAAFLQPVAEAVLPLLGHLLSEEVKQKALETMAALIGAAKQLLTATAAAALVVRDSGAAAEHTQLQQLQQIANNSRDLLRAMLMKTSEAVYRHLADEDADDVDMLISEAAGLNDCLTKAGSDVLTEDEVAQQALAVFQALETSFQRRIEIAARKHRTDEEVDEDEILEAEEEEQQEQTLRSTLLEIVGSLMATHAGQFLRSKAGEAAIGFVQQFLKDDVTDEDRSIALYVCDDIIQHLKQDGLALWPPLMSKVLQCLLSEDPRVLQAAAYGVQQATLLQQAFQPYIQEAAKNLLVAVSRPKKRKNKAEQAATDNAVAAVGDVLQHHGALLTQQEQEVVVTAWLDNLPLKQDDTEGVRIHKQLLDAVLQNNPLVLGANNSNIPRLLQVLCSVYKTPFSDDELNEGIRKLFLQINQNAQPAPLGSLVQRFTPKEQRKLHKMLNKRA